MSSLTQTFLTRSKIISHYGALISESPYNNKFTIVPQWKGGYSNTVARSSSGDYNGGDRVIGFPNGYEVDGDLLFTVGWGDGFAVRRLNNDGTLTRIYYDNYFLYRDTTSTYNHMHNIAIDTTNKLGVAMTHNVDGYTTFDYSGCVNGGTTFVKDARPTHTNPQRFIGGAGSSGLNISSVGLYYSSGLVAAGEWIYAGEYSARHYRRAVRRNLNTGVEEVIGNSSGTGDLYSGSATIDRDGYRFTLSYDEVNDRVFYQAYYNGSMIVVLDASTSSPELLWVDLGDAGQGTNSYDMGIFVPDPVNSPNRLIIGHYDRINDIDITPCFSGSSPTINATSSTTNYFPTNPLLRVGTKYQKTSGTPMDKLPGYPNHVRTSADRGWNDIEGWVDIDNDCRPVGISNFDTYTEDQSNGRGRSTYYDYGCPGVLMSSANGTKYWVKMGYGGDGHQFATYAESTKPFELKGNWEVVFGTFTLANNANIDQVAIPQAGDGFGVPSNTSLTVYVSNDNGSTWETYDTSTTTNHTFTSLGTQLRIKFYASGQPDKAPYYSGNSGEGRLQVFYGSLHEAAKDANIKFKINRKRLRH